MVTRHLTQADATIWVAPGSELIQPRPEPLHLITCQTSPLKHPTGLSNSLIQHSPHCLYLSSKLPTLSFMPCSVLGMAPLKPETRGPSSKLVSPSVPGEGSHSLHALVQTFPPPCFPFPRPHCGQDRLFYHVLPGQSPNFSGVPGP